MIRCVLESLALLYAKTLRECAEATGRTFTTLHVVGGGSKNKLLNQFTANAVQLLGVEKVAAGPVESTALGNVLIQAKALGHLAGDLRGAVRRSFPVETYAPRRPRGLERRPGAVRSPARPGPERRGRGRDGRSGDRRMLIT